MKSTNLSRLIGNRIGRIRYERGETQKELGEALGKTRTDVNRWESGDRGVSAENLIAIAEHYNVSTDYLLGILPEGITEIKGDKRTAQQYTGLTNEALENLKSIKDNCKPEVLEILSAILSSRKLTSILIDIQEALYITQIPNLPRVPKTKMFKESGVTFQIEEDEDGNKYLMVNTDYRKASHYCKQSALESFGKVIDEVIGEDGK